MTQDTASLGIVVIGRNEGERLRRCLAAINAGGRPLIYVDSGSTDDSVAVARQMEAEVVCLDPVRPFTAARARNAGFKALLQRWPATRWVQFVDGDCELADGWLELAQQQLAAHEQWAVVFGRLRERRRSETIYNRLCDMEWAGPPGEAAACGGNAMMRVEALRAARGFREDLTAGEEPELCLRLRAAGWKVQRLDAEMGLHDADMSRLGQWWRRTVRSGLAFAQSLALHGWRDGQAWRQTLSIWFWMGALPATAVVGAVGTGGASLLLLALYGLLVGRIAHGRHRAGDSVKDAWLYALFTTLGKAAQLQGQVQWALRRLRGQTPRLIEYRTAESAPAQRTAPCGTVAGRNGAMRIAYLVNQYPKVSHSFIRREVAALEAQGLAVKRFSLRRCQEQLVDPQDEAERRRTTVILEAGARRLLTCVARHGAGNPWRLVRTIGLSLRCARQSGCGPSGVLRHLVYVAEACYLHRELRQWGAQHLHAHFGTNSATVAMLCRELGGPPFSFTVHGPEEFDAPEALSLPRKIQAAAFVVAVSHFGRSQLYRWCRHELWPKVHVVHCGLDSQFLEGTRTAVPDTAKLVSVGRLCEQKGQQLLIEAASQLKRAGIPFELTLVGDGEMRGAIERLIASHGLENQVRITGWASSEQVRQYLLESRALVQPSFAEGLPVVIMEAMALGRPVISTYVAGIPELVDPGVNGWLVPPGSVEALTGAMRHALQLPVDELQRLGASGAARVASQHDAVAEAGKLAALFRGQVPSAEASVVRQGALAYS